MTDAGLKKWKQPYHKLATSQRVWQVMELYGTANCTRPNGNLQDLMAHSTADLQVPTLPWQSDSGDSKHGGVAVNNPRSISVLW